MQNVVNMQQSVHLNNVKLTNVMSTTNICSIDHLQDIKFAKREVVIEELKQYFSIKELVCKHCYDKFGDKSWQFLDRELLDLILALRKFILKVPLVVNTWHNGGDLTQRGLRCNICSIPKEKTKQNTIYLSAHCNGAAIDCQSPDMSAAQMRKLIKQNADNLPHRCRIEKDVTWLHIDCFAVTTNDYMVNEFNG